MLLRLSLPVLMLLLALACSPGGDAVPQPAPQGGAPSQPAGDRSDPAGEDTDDADVTVAADAKVDGTCNPRPREGKDGEELTAAIEIANTGDLGVKVRVAAKWPQPQGQGIIRWKRVNVEQGETRKLTLRLAVGAAEAEAVRTAADQGRTCGLTHRVIGAYGS